jgi:hypothetical protein
LQGGIIYAEEYKNEYEKLFTQQIA